MGDNVITKHDFETENEIQISDTGLSMTMGENDDSVGWRNHPEI